LPRLLWLLKLLHCDWTWLRIHKLWLSEAWAKLIWHWGGDTHHCLFHDIGSISMDLLGCGLWVSGVLFPFPFPCVQILLLCLVYCFDWVEDFPRYWCFMESRVEVSTSFLCCLVLLHSV
jgi:hypothetical protein